MTTAAIVPAAGLGERMGADKALLDLGGDTAIERVVATCRAAGIDHVVVVRRAGAAPLPATGAQVVEVAAGGEMADSLRAARATLSAAVTQVVVFPVDHALVRADTVLALLGALDRLGGGVALPLFDERPGHPVAMARAVFDEIEDPAATLRDLVRREPARVRVVPTASSWVRADLDHPQDLRAARNALAGSPWSTVEQMFRHRSHRAYRGYPLPQAQVERLVDAARHASTSSFIQAYAVVAVVDQARRGEVARLCGGQPHITQAPVFFAICADLHKIAAACARHGTQVQAQSFELFVQATVDAALLGQNLQLAAEAEGLGACMIGAARNHPIELAQLLGLPAHCYVVFGMTVGVPADDPIARGRMPLPGVLHWERYDEAVLDAVFDGADEGMREWSRRTNAERGGYNGRPVSERKGWVERMAIMWGGESSYAAARQTLLDELRRLGFGPF
ncbi:MAG: NTP transferase domain-containing protein [Planctomycetes bacterium]|nr:NTP transferase domain-containing protein [Planctomycetota bacterium]MCB9884481.1 NTP transferase domain-containing protein [Planctomycetota bacterium]